MDYAVPDGIELVDKMQPAANPYEDRITSILQRRSQSYAQPEFSSDQMINATQAAVYNALGGGSQGVDQILEAIRAPQLARDERELNDATTLYNLFETKRANGDKQAQALFDKIKMFTGDDPNGMSMFLSELHNDPESIDPSNSYQVMTKLAGIMKRTGYESPEAQMSKLDIQAKQLGLKKTQAEIAKLYRVDSSGGDLPAALQMANEYNKARASGNIQRMNDILLFTKALNKGQGVTDESGTIGNLSGYTSSVLDSKKAEATGTSFGKDQGNAIFDLPRVRLVSKQATTAIDNAINAPGMKNVTGLMSKVPIIPGGERARADALLDQVGGRVFLTAYDMLKGGGQITEVEGAKAEQAIATIGRAQRYEDVILGLNDLKSAIDDSLKMKEIQASSTPQQILQQGQTSKPSSSSGVKFLGFE